MSDMSSQETIERFVEGLKKAASRCRELSKIQKNKMWLNVASGFDNMRINGVKIYEAASLSRQEILATVDAMVGKKIESEE